MPSSALRQDSAAPSTLTMLRFTARISGAASGPESGSSTGMIFSLSKGPKTWVMPFLSSTRASEA